MRPVAVSTALFDGHGMDRAVAEIAAAGARFVEPAFIRGYVDFDETAFSQADAASLRRLAEANGLAAVAVSAHLDLASPGAAEALRRRIGFAAALGARILVTNAGPAAGRSAVLASIGAVLGLCEESGVVLALENPGHGAGDLVKDAAAGAALVEAIASPAVRLNYDVGNVFTYSGEAVRPEEDIAAAAPFLAHVHLKDVRSAAAGWTFTAIGDGSIDYPALWPCLPPGVPVAIELPLRLDRRGRRDPVRRPDPVPLNDILAALRRSLRFVEALELGWPAGRKPG